MEGSGYFMLIGRCKQWGGRGQGTDGSGNWNGCL